MAIVSFILPLMAALIITLSLTSIMVIVPAVYSYRFFKRKKSMNYLAHAYLSFHDPEVLVGNMISDFVKGKKQYDYPDGIQKGIRLHRIIDLFYGSAYGY